MKKGKVIGKGQIIAFLMIVCLGGAIFLNMKYSSSEKFLGETKYVSKNTSSAVKTSANVTQSSDYFETAKQEREKAYKKIEETVKETLKSDKLTDEDKKAAIEKIGNLAARIENVNNIESLLLAKGFKKALAVISDKNINIIVKSDELTTAQTLQIQDIVTTQTGENLSNIKIVTVK